MQHAPHELPAEIDLEPTRYQLHLLGKQAPAQQRVVNALAVSQDLPKLKLARRIAECCRGSTLATSPTGHLRLLEFRCKSKLCPTCSRRRSQVCFHRVRTAVAAMNSPRMLTLTLKHSHDSLRSQLLRIRRCFANLRRTDVWKHHVRGGTYVLEITRNQKAHQWHPHLHIIADGDYFQHAQLRAAWKQATGDSDIVHIRKVNDAAAAATYTAKYITKTMDPSELTDDQLLEWIDEVRGIRFLQTFGTLHRLKLDTKEKLPSDYKQLSPLGSVDKLYRASLAGLDEAKQLFAYAIGCRHRRPQSPVNGVTPEPPAAEREIVARLRAWFRNQEKLSSDIAAQTHDPPGIDRSCDRPLWERQDSDVAADQRPPVEPRHAHVSHA